MPLILGTNSIKDTGYDVDNSLMFDGADSYLNITSGSSPTSTKKFTVSFWLKRSELGREQHIFGGVSAAQCYFVSDDRLRFADTTSGTNYYTTQKFRDVSAWYHIVIAVDTTLGTAGDRARIYVNGSEITAFDTETNATQNNNTAYNIGSTAYVIGRYNPSQSQNYYYSGYMTEYVFIDGQQLAPTSFGEFDEDSGIWKPIDVSGLTFGTNGFYLDYEDSGDLGDDESGNGNDFTENNLAATDQSTDTCTNNFATMNSLDNYYASTTFSEGNLKMVTNGSAIVYNVSTIGFDTGKWYMEVKLGSSSGEVLGVITGPATANDNDNKIGNRADGWGYDYRGLVENAGVDEGGTFAAFDSGDVIGVYADLDNDKIYFSKNGTLQNSGTGLDLDVAGSPTYFFAVGDNHGSNAATFEVNFGNPVSALSSAVSDGTYGSFEYSTTITGDGASKTFKALNTKNLAEFG